MDLLSDLLQQCGLQRRLLDLQVLPEGRALRFPCERSMGLHTVSQGRLYLHAPMLPEPLLLQAGDIAVMARGCVHTLSTSADAPPADTPALRFAAEGEAPETGARATEGAAVVISGAYQFWNEPLHPFFREMPAWHVLRAAALPRLGSLSLALTLLNDEMRQRGPGSTMAVHGLLDLVYTLLLRELLDSRQAGADGWGLAVRDPQVRRSVELMHADCARAWTLDELARSAGLSRTSLAERFRATMGDTPLAYLRTLRMQKAMQLLSQTAGKLEDVAIQVGYQDAFSFSKVFKRATGLSPKAFRSRDAAEKALPWRLGTG